MANDSIRLKYLVTSPQDKDRGLTITSVGKQTVKPGESYPPREHPTRYHFSPGTGRILDEYQLLYITSGEGLFWDAEGKEYSVKEGNMFLLFPGKWHSYTPNAATGWTEMWIGFNGEIIESWHRMGIVSESHQIFHVGSREDITSMYQQAIKCADQQESGYQQMLCGIVCHLMSSCVYYDRNALYHQDRVGEIIGKIRLFIDSNIVDVTPESASAAVNVGYSKMRKLFKQYTGLTLGQYISEVKTNKAKNLLSNSDLPIGEIASMLGYENEEYFSTSFKRMTGEKPTMFRKRMRFVNPA